MAARVARVQRVTGAALCMYHATRVTQHGMRSRVMRIHRILLLLLAVFLLAGCGYNSIQSKDEGVKAAWSEVVNQYQRRADLVPNLVNTVKGYAEHEEEVFTKVTEARAQVGKITISADDLADEAKLKQFQAAQGELSGALSRLMAVSENYPTLKADALFQTLQTQLEGTENRITVARNRYITAVQDYNVFVRSFPQNLTAMMFGYKTKANFTVENEKAISTAPTVDFKKPAAPPAQPPAQPAH
jgi:LemA protein